MLKRKSIIAYYIILIFTACFFHKSAGPACAVETVEVLTGGNKLVVEYKKQYKNGVSSFSDFDETDEIKIKDLKVTPFASGGLYIQFDPDNANLYKIQFIDDANGETIEVFTKFIDLLFRDIESDSRKYKVNVTGYNIAAKKKCRPVAAPGEYETFKRPANEGDNIILFYLDGADNLQLARMKVTKKIGGFYFLIPDYVKNFEPPANAQALFEQLYNFDEATYGNVFNAAVSQPENRPFTIAVLDNIGQFTMGYHWGISHFVPYEKSRSNWESNNMHMVYLNTRYVLDNSTTNASGEVVFKFKANLNKSFGTFAHELQHHIHFEADPRESSWLNEGMSVLSEDLTNYFAVPSRITGAFAKFPSMRLNFKTHKLTQPQYGLGYLFCRYIYEKIGAGTIKNIVQNALTQDIESCAADPDDLFMKFTTAMILNDKTTEYGFNSDTIPASLKCDSTEIIYNVPELKDIRAAASTKKQKVKIYRYSANYFSIRPDKPIDEKAPNNYSRVTINYKSDSGRPLFEGRIALLDENNKPTVEKIVTAPLSKPMSNGSNFAGEFLVRDYGTKVKRFALNCSNINKDYVSDFDSDEVEITVGPPENIIITEPASTACVGGKNNKIVAKIGFNPDMAKLVKNVRFIARNYKLSKNGYDDADFSKLGFVAIGEKGPGESDDQVDINWDVTGDDFKHDDWYELAAIGYDKDNKEITRTFDAAGSGIVFVRIDKLCDIGISYPMNGADYSGEENNCKISVCGWVESEAKSANLNGAAIAVSKNWTNFSIDQTLHEGENVFTLKAVDKFDNEGEVRVSVFYRKIEKKKDDKDKTKPEDVKHGDPTFIQVDREDE